MIEAELQVPSHHHPININLNKKSSKSSLLLIRRQMDKSIETNTFRILKGEIMVIPRVPIRLVILLSSETSMVMVKKEMDIKCQRKQVTQADSIICLVLTSSGFETTPIRSSISRRRSASPPLHHLSSFSSTENQVLDQNLIF